MVLHTINLSRTSLGVFNGSVLAGCSDLRALNILSSKMTTITQDGFHKRFPAQKFPSDLLRSLVSLKVVQADNYKLMLQSYASRGFRHK